MKSQSDIPHFHLGNSAPFLSRFTFNGLFPKLLSLNNQVCLKAVDRFVSIKSPYREDERNRSHHNLC